ncbi:phage tail protein [Salmonella enterica subsp. enterica serovar Give]|nr:phage tail protein [Salmonella enterica subsp. enterica serovar Give]EJX6010790.1 phage tail protein [Salmonella enterica]
MLTAGNVTTTDDKITLLLAGGARSDWQRYRIDSDFLKPADAWSLSLGLPENVFPSQAIRGAPVQLQVGGETVLTGRIDSVQRRIARQGQMTLTLNGRDATAILVDCAAPIFSARQLTLDAAIAAIVRPLGIKRIRIQADGVTRNDSIHIEPGERAWDALVRVAAGRGLWPWCDPDGTLVIGGPDYSRPPVATLVLKPSTGEVNVLSLEDTSSINGCYSELTVLAQSHASQADNLAVLDLSDTPDAPGQNAGESGSDSDDDDDDSGCGESGHYSRSRTIKDPDVPYYRPQVLVVGDVDNPEQVQFRARKAMADAHLSGYDLQIDVPGHRTPGGQLWTPGQRVHVISEPHDIDDTYFLMGRSFSGGRPGGQTTTLRLKEDGIWIPDAYPKARHKHRHKKKKTELAVIPVWDMK